MRTAKWRDSRIEQINFLLIHNYLENPQAFLPLVFQKTEIEKKHYIENAHRSK